MKPQQTIARPQMQDVFGCQVPTDAYYLHQGHAWAALEETGQVRVGLDDFSQKIMGPADDLKLPEIGKTYHQDHICLSLFKQGRKAYFEAPVDGVIVAVNPKVRQQPNLVHDDPYGEGWLFLVKPTNFQLNLDNLFSGEANVTWINEETQRLLSLMESTVGITLPSGGAVVDDLYSHYPDIGWRPLIKEFFSRHLTTKVLAEGSVKDLWQDVYNSANLHYCFNCSTCISGCPASNGDPPLLVRNLARKVIMGLEEELLEDDTPWACVSCSRCEEMCPQNVMPFEMILAIRQWQCRNDETLIPSAIVEIYKRGFTQAVGVNTELRDSLGLPHLNTITNNQEQLKLFQEMLMKTQIVSENDYMFSG
jgi:heterodisulfide reductase subunit C/glycine cleavage system H lipoate-binding protein